MPDELVPLIITLLVLLAVASYIFARHSRKPFKAPNECTTAQEINHLRVKNAQGDIRIEKPWSEVSIGQRRGQK
jgi:hypothetical protein